MAGLDTRGLADGFAQGFGLMDRYQRGQRADERADQQMEMQQERMGMQRERMDMQREQYDAQQQEAQRAQDMEALQFTLGKIGSGMEVDESEIELLRQYPKYWAALDPDTDASIEQAQQVIDPQSPVDANDPESLAALNQMFGAEINRGEGGQKRVVGMVPGPDGESVMLELEVVGEDGSRYNAPMTQGRSNREDDDLVMSVPVERLVEQTQGMRMLRNVFQSPEAQQRASQVLGLLRGDSAESWDLEEHPRLGMIQVNRQTGEVKPVRPGAGSPYDRSGSSNYWNRPTATQKDIEYMVENGLAPDRETAWRMLRENGRDNSYSRSEDRIDALRTRAESLEEVIMGEGAIIPSDAEIEAAREELRFLQQEIRKEENRTYGIRSPGGSSPAPSDQEARPSPKAEAPRQATQTERGQRPGPEPKKPSQSGPVSADDILNKYL